MSLSVASIAGLSVLGFIILTLMLIVFIIIPSCICKKYFSKIKICCHYDQEQEEKNQEEFLNTLKTKEIVNSLNEQSNNDNLPHASVPNKDKISSNRNDNKNISNINSIKLRYGHTPQISSIRNGKKGNSKSFLITLNSAIKIQRFYRTYHARKLFKQHIKMNPFKTMQIGNISSTVTLSMLLIYDVVYYGSTIVDQCFGIDILHKSTKKLMSNSTNTKKNVRIQITPKSVYVIDANCFHVLFHVGTNFISFCSLDPDDSQIFGFINRSDGVNFCHVFKGIQNSPKQILELFAESFENVSRKYSFEVPKF